LEISQKEPKRGGGGSGVDEGGSSVLSWGSRRKQFVKRGRPGLDIKEKGGGRLNGRCLTGAGQGR